jgi:hypothetical protein
MDVHGHVAPSEVGKNSSLFSLLINYDLYSIIHGVTLSFGRSTQEAY